MIFKRLVILFLVFYAFHASCPRFPRPWAEDERPDCQEQPLSPASPKKPFFYKASLEKLSWIIEFLNAGLDEINRIKAWQDGGNLISNFDFFPKDPCQKPFELVSIFLKDRLFCNSDFVRVVYNFFAVKYEARQLSQTQITEMTHSYLDSLRAKFSSFMPAIFSYICQSGKTSLIDEFDSKITSFLNELDGIRSILEFINQQMANNPDFLEVFTDQVLFIEVKAFIEGGENVL